MPPMSQSRRVARALVPLLALATHALSAQGAPDAPRAPTAAEAFAAVPRPVGLAPLREATIAPPPRVLAADTIARRGKSPGRALALSVAATVTPFVLDLVSCASDDDVMFCADPDSPQYWLMPFSIGLGPAVGYWHGGASRRGWQGVGMRALIATGAVLVALAADSGDDIGPSDQSSALLIGGAAALGAATIYDIVRIPHHVREANRR